MAGEGALLGFKFLLARTGNTVDFAKEEREMLWHAADQLTSIKNRFKKNGFNFTEPRIEGHLDQFIERLIGFSESGELTRNITYKENELISFYLDQLYKDSDENEEICSMINNYISNEEWGYQRLIEYFQHCEKVKNFTSDLNYNG